MPVSIRQTLTAGASLAVVLGVSAPLVARTDDPKPRDAQPVYTGPGYRAGQGSAHGFPSLNMELLAWITIPEFGVGASGANDCWGYTSPAGREYAIICLRNATGFVDITTPTNPVIVGTVEAPSCTWHDAKIYEHPTEGAYCYVVSECGRGIQVIDISDIDNGNINYIGDVDSMDRPDSHNVALNEASGYLYRTGGSGGGLLIYDLNADPSNPPLVGSWSDGYVHDAQVHTYTDGPYAGREIAFTCGGSDGVLEILDVTDKQNIFTTDRFFYSSSAYSHQGWLSADGQYFYLNDEGDEGEFGFDTRTRILNVSDIDNVTEEPFFSSDTPSIDHNLYVRDNLIFEANYRSGIRVFDATDQLNPEQIAYFDTYPADDDPNFSGLWSCFPFFESGLVIGSDTSQGLFVWRVGVPLIAYEFPNGLPDQIDPAGDTIDLNIVEFVKGGLVEDSAMLNYDAGSDGFVPVPLESLGGDAFRAHFPAIDCGTSVSYYFSAEMSDGFPLNSPPGAPATTYSTLAANDVVVAFQDDMESDRGYIVVSEDLTDGEWERGVPAGDGDRGDPTEDFDGSGAAWLTGNRPGNSDVDGGPTRLTTPQIDMSTLNAPIVSYARWFYNDDQDADRLVVEISNDDGSSWSLVENVSDAGEQWVVHSFSALDIISPLTEEMRLRFSVTDNPNDSVTEAAIDALVISAVTCDAPCPEDLDGNGAVDFGDIREILTAWGESGGPADLDGSGTVDFGDILIVLTAWGPCP